MRASLRVVRRIQNAVCDASANGVVKPARPFFTVEKVRKAFYCLASGPLV